MHKKSFSTSSAKRYQAGFTLLELSIFFMIAAALTLTIFKGKDLIFAYKVQATIKEYQEHLTSHRAFKSKYGYLPGDFPFATRIWPDLGDGTSGGSTYSGNGDGNGFIDEGDLKFDGIQHYIRYMESTFGWGHLSREGLVAGSYKGSPNPRCFDPSGHCKDEGGSYTSNRNRGNYVTAELHAPKASLPTSIPSCDFDYVNGKINPGAGMYDESLACRGRAMWMARRYEWMDRHQSGYSRDSAWSQIFNVFTITSDLRYYGEGHIHIFYPTFCSSAQILDNKIDDGKPFTGSITADWTCKHPKHTCSGNACFSQSPSSFDYVDPSQGDVPNKNDTFINFLIGDGDI